VELNAFTHALARLVRRHLLDEKWLLAPSLRVGFQWLDAVTRAGQPVVNVRVRTVRQLAVALAAPGLERQGLELVTRQQQEHLTARVLGRLRHQGEGYLSSLEPSPGLVRTVRRAMGDLRLAGISARELRDREPGWVEVAAKGRELAALLAAYERELARARLADHADVLRMASARLQEDLFALPSGVLVVAPDDLQLARLERALFLSISATRRRTLPVDRPVDSDAGVEVVSAVGESNEVRAVLRRCVERGIALDEVELLHTDTAVYVPLVLELVSALDPDVEPAVTFAEGLPARLSRPGRALLAWLHWTSEGYPQPALERMLEDGLLRLPDHDPDDPDRVRGTELAALLRTLSVGAGRHRYLPILDRELRREAGEARLELLRPLRRLVADLLEHAPPADARRGHRATLAAAARFMERGAACSGKLDEYGRAQLQARIQEQLACVERWGHAVGLDLRQWLASQPDEVRVGGQGPMPGRLHVDNLLSGGHSHRRLTVVVGLEDGRFPSSGRQDPLLLDSERRALSRELPTAAERLGREAAVLPRLAARRRGELVLSYACRSLDDRELYPSGAIVALPAARLDRPRVASLWAPAATGCAAPGSPLASPPNPARAPSLLPSASSAPPPESFVPRSAASCVDRAGWWLFRLCRQGQLLLPPPTPSGPQLAHRGLARDFPNLDRGWRARRARLSDRLTEYDGYVPEAGPDLDPRAPAGPVLSATALETLGRCPLEFFLRHVLEVAPTPATGVDPDVWLDPSTRGAVLHEVFHRFMCHLVERGLLPEFERDEKLALDLLDRRLASERRRRPPPSGEVFQRDLSRLQRSVRIFLREEEELCRSHRPLYFEVAVGVRAAGRGTALDCRQPVAIRLPGGGAVRARGMIDRIDGLPGDERRFAVWDYKTGSSRRYSEHDPFREGRVVQSALYVALARARLAAATAPGGSPRVARFGYFFPSTTEYGKRVVWDAADLSEGLEVIEQLCLLMAAGCFPCSDRPTDLGFSDYRNVVGDVAAVAAAVADKLENPENHALAPLRRLRGYEDPEP